jgi:hypothetical protein
MMYIMGVAMALYTFPTLTSISLWTMQLVVKATMHVLAPAVLEETRIRQIVQSELTKQKNNLQVGGCDLILSS